MQWGERGRGNVLANIHEGFSVLIRKFYSVRERESERGGWAWREGGESPWERVRERGGWAWREGGESLWARGVSVEGGGWQSVSEGGERGGRGVRVHERGGWAWREGGESPWARGVSVEGGGWESMRESPWARGVSMEGGGWESMRESPWARGVSVEGGGWESMSEGGERGGRGVRVRERGGVSVEGGGWESVSEGGERGGRGWESVSDGGERGGREGDRFGIIQMLPPTKGRELLFRSHFRARNPLCKAISRLIWMSRSRLYYIINGALYKPLLCRWSQFFTVDSCLGYK